VKKINVGILGKGHWGKKIYSKIKKDVNIIFFLGNLLMKISITMLQKYAQKARLL
jgi:hypothetical protein